MDRPDKKKAARDSRFVGYKKVNPISFVQFIPLDCESIVVVLHGKSF